MEAATTAQWTQLIWNSIENILRFIVFIYCVCDCHDF